MVRLKKFLVTMIFCLLVSAGAVLADSWGNINNSTYTTSYMSYAKQMDNSYATVNVTNGPVYGRCRIHAYITRVDNTAYKTVTKVWQIEGPDKHAYLTPFSLNNYKGYRFSVCAMIDKTSYITSTSLQGTLVP